MSPDTVIFRDEAYAIMGACFAVYRDKGCGFLEAVYQECLEIEFEYCNIPAKAKQPLLLNYRGRTLRQVYEPARETRQRKEEEIARETRERTRKQDTENLRGIQIDSG